MDYSFFLREALPLAARAVSAVERHVTVAEDRLAWARERPPVDEHLLPGEHGPHDGPPPPPKAADDFAFHMPAAPMAACTCESEATRRHFLLTLDGNELRIEEGATLERVRFGGSDAAVTDLQRAQAEVLIERARCEALERQVAELQAARRPSGIVSELARVLDRPHGPGHRSSSRPVRAAVSTLQAALGLMEDGFVGPQTLVAVAEVYAGHRS